MGKKTNNFETLTFILILMLSSCSKSTIELFNLGGPIMWILLVLSLISLAIVIEKIIFFLVRYKDKQKYFKKMIKDTKTLRTISNLSPLAGFLGTVLGMLSSFDSMSKTETITPKIVSKGIYEALITTAFGLIISLFCLISIFFIEKLTEKREKVDSNEQ